MSVNVYINATIPFVIHIVRHLIRSQSLFRLPLIFFETLYVPVIYDFFFCCVDRRKQWLNTDVCQEYIYFTIAASSILFFLLLGDGAMSKHNLGYYRQKPFVFKQVAFLCLCTLFALHRRQSTLRCRPCSFDGHNPFVRPIIGRSRKERL